MRTIDLESLKIFRTVVDEGGVVRAANKLNRVQSNVTTRIRQLEEHLGTRLFRREGRSIRLSAEGHTLLAYTDRLLRLADETVSEMRTGKPKGVFRLGALESTAGSRLAPLRPAKRSRQQRPFDTLNLCVKVCSLLRQQHRLLCGEAAGNQPRRKVLGTNLFSANRNH